MYICEEKPWFDKFFYKNNGEIRDEFLNEYLSYLKIISDEKYINKFLNKYRKKIKNLNNAFYSDFSKKDDIFWKGLFPYTYDKNFLYDRASIIRSKILNYNSEKLKVSLNDHKLEFDTIFLGGGTPSLIDPHYIEKIFNLQTNSYDNLMSINNNAV